MVGQRHSRSHAPPPVVHGREEKHRGKEKTQKQRDILVSDESTATGDSRRNQTDDVIKKGQKWIGTAWSGGMSNALNPEPKGPFTLDAVVRDFFLTPIKYLEIELNATLHTSEAISIYQRSNHFTPW